MVPTNLFAFSYSFYGDYWHEISGHRLVGTTLGHFKRTLLWAPPWDTTLGPSVGTLVGTTLGHFCEHLQKDCVSILMRTTLSAPAGNGLASLHGPGGLGATPCPNIVPRYPNLTSPWTLMARSHMIAKRKTVWVWCYKSC